MEDLVRTAGERETLEAFLDSHRQVTVDKLRGLSEADARRRLVPSATTPIGLVKHLTGVERNWFQHILAGRPRADIPGESAGVHLIREHARHNGHADILREQLDGTTGA
ncbi:DUF664 domain-containing protein [Kribbella sp. NPDC058693]|uniref:DUF664 domain-containing protein n=1 Tax=Kribbella jiaozuonensis TaxID=2575441 RepID=A0A4U3LPL9_9ACTN|nr:DUF664 domain-containing protein [Kribbella jiaozuonensis]TKK77610.1 DUF664 domain-containing protein [Kribbella jiaozuonensis]